MQKVLVFFPTYNESENVTSLIDSILKYLPDAYLLIVDDASPDGTGKLLEQLKIKYQKLSIIHRPRKMGIGSAHKLAMLYSIEYNFDILITMDADFSHHPKYLPKLQKLLENFDFVTGSRYIKGGSCEYGFYRTLISRAANIISRIALGLKLKENTTVYRGFQVSLLRRMNLNKIKADGYSYAIESLHLIGYHTNLLTEFPIHFSDRRAGTSKISKNEIFKAILTICRLFIEKLFQNDFFSSDLPINNKKFIESKNKKDKKDKKDDRCKSCGGIFYTEVVPPKNQNRKNLEGQPRDKSSYSCSNHSLRTHGQIVRCLQCGLTFLKPTLSEEQLIYEYSKIVDPPYLKNIKARELTSLYNFMQVKQYMDSGKTLLDIGSYCGAFLKVATQNKLHVVGVEPSPWAVKTSLDIIDADVIQGTLNDIPKNSSKFDIITMWDVLEHFSDPVKELKQINKQLKSDGVLIFSTLMIDNWFPKITGKNWPWYMDMHLFYFTESTLAAMLGQAGFNIIESKKYCHIITLEYLLSKLDTLEVRFISFFAKSLASRVVKFKLSQKTIPFKFGDIKLFVCNKKENMENMENFESRL